MIKKEWTKKSTLFVIRRRIESVIIDAFEAQCIRENAIGLLHFIHFTVF